MTITTKIVVSLQSKRTPISAIVKKIFMEARSRLIRNVGKYLRTVVLVICALACAGQADAQLRYGLRLGGDFAKATLATGDNIPGALLDNGSGFSGGVLLEYQFRKCGFAPDIAVLYTRFDTRLVLHGSSPLDFGRDFIEIPLHLKWKFLLKPTKDLCAVMIYTGPSMLVRLGHGEGVALGGASRQTFASEKLQPGWDVGIGIDVINFIQLTAGYRFGIGNAATRPADMVLHTNGWSVAANLLFDF